MVLKANAASVPRAERIIRRATLIASDSVGDAVYVSGPRSGVLYDVTKLQVTTGNEPAFAGVIIKKFSDTEGLVQFAGPVLGIYGGLTPGSRYFVGNDALPTLTPDQFSHPMGIATSDDEIVIEQNLTGGAGIDEGAHEALDTLVHGLAEDSYTEVTRDPVTQLITAVTTWTDVGKTTKVREVLIARNSSRLITQIDRIQYDAAGAEKYRTTETIARAGTLRPRLSSITMDRTP